MEIGFRIYLHYYGPNPQREEDQALGWRVKENFHKTFDIPHIGKVNYSTQKHGFRKWGNIHTTKKKILVVGDSYTSACQISDGFCYYDYLDTTHYELFVFGCGGYGTLQELMAVEKHIQAISPDLIVWQFCHNDLINNSLELDRKSYINNMLIKKPYWINNTIEYHFPHPFKILGYIEKVSKISYWLHLKLNYWLWAKFGSIESEYDKTDTRFKNSFKTTEQLYKKIKDLGYPLVVFSVTTSFGYDEIQSICRTLNIPFISPINDTLDHLTNEGVKLDYAPYDWHWNLEGHKVAGEVLNKEINNYL